MRWTLSGRAAVPAGSAMTTSSSSSRRPPTAPRSTLATVAGAGHGFSTDPHQHPTSIELTAAVTGFFTTTVG